MRFSFGLPPKEMEALTESQTSTKPPAENGGKGGWNVVSEASGKWRRANSDDYSAKKTITLSSI
jgi:hypothetical protein